MRFCFERIPLISRMMSFNSSWHWSKYVFKPATPFSMASSTCCVQYVWPTQRTVWPGHSRTQTVLALIWYAMIAWCTMWRTLFRISDSSSINHFSTCPLAMEVDMISRILTSSPSVDRIASTSSSSLNFSRAMPSKHFFKCGCTLKNNFV